MTQFHSLIRAHACTALDRGAGERDTAETQWLTTTILTILHQDLELVVEYIQEDTGIYF